VPNVLQNIFQATEDGGRVVHISPSSNYLDHGFYMFSPTLFWDFYRTNEWTIHSLQLARQTSRLDRDPWQISNYRPGSLGEISVGGLDDHAYDTVCIASKTATSTGHRIPQPGYYLDEWSSEVVDVGGEDERPSPGSVATLKRVVAGHPALYRPAVRILTYLRWQRRRLRKKGLGQDVVARY